MQFMPEEEKLPFLTWHPSGLIPYTVIAKCVQNTNLQNCKFMAVWLFPEYIRLHSTLCFCKNFISGVLTPKTFHSYGTDYIYSFLELVDCERINSVLKSLLYW